MTQLSTSNARLVDPILTTVAQGYKNADFVGISLFPQVAVQQRGGKILSFSKEDFELYTTQRAPGGATKRVQFGYSGQNFALQSHSMEGVVPYELQQDASVVPGIDLGSMAVRRVQNIIGLRLEYEQANLATTAANYGAANKLTSLVGTSLWSDPTSSDPIGAVESAKDAIRQSTGRYPDTMVIGAQVMKALRQHSKIIDRIKYTGRDIPTADLLASLFGVRQVLVGNPVYTDQSGNSVDVWGKNAVLAITDISGIADIGSPSYGYTYRLGGYPIVEQPYQERNQKSWIYPITDEVAPVMASSIAGYLISPAVA